MGAPSFAPGEGWGTDRSDDRQRSIPVHGDQGIIIEFDGPIVGDRREMKVPVFIVSTKPTRHRPSLSDNVSVPHPSLEAKDGAPSAKLWYRRRKKPGLMHQGDELGAVAEAVMTHRSFR